MNHRDPSGLVSTGECIEYDEYDVECYSDPDSGQGRPAKCGPGYHWVAAEQECVIDPRLPPAPILGILGITRAE